MDHIIVSADSATDGKARRPPVENSFYVSKYKEGVTASQQKTAHKKRLKKQFNQKTGIFQVILIVI